jgi:cytochrome c-type biogenesis protein
MGVPFLLTAFCLHYFLRVFQKVKNYLGVIEKICGGIMVVLGILILSNKLFAVSGYLSFFSLFAI